MAATPAGCLCQPFPGSPTRETILWAALLRAGPGAVLSHQTAAERHGLIDEPSSLIAITVPASRTPARAKIPGVVIHRSDAILRTTHPAMLPPCTRVEDTVLDLIQIAPTFDDAYAWICRAVGRRRTTADRIRHAMDARKKMRWRRELTMALGEAGEGALSRAGIPLRSPGGTPARACPPLVGRRGSGSVLATSTSTTSTRSTGCARNSTGPRRIPPTSSGVISAATTPTRSRASSRSGSALPTSAIVDARPRPTSPPCCVCAAGRALRTPALAQPAPFGTQFHDREQFWALFVANRSRS